MKTLKDITHLFSATDFGQLEGSWIEKDRQGYATGEYVRKEFKAAAIERIKAYQESDAVYARDIHGAFRRCKLQARIDELMDFFNLTPEDLKEKITVVDKVELKGASMWKE